MRLQYMYHREENEPHPFYMKSNWNPPVQKSVALESYLDKVKLSLAKINLTKPKNNLLARERVALDTLRSDKQINLKKADKGTSTVIMNREDKINKGQIQLNVTEHYRPLETPMVEETDKRVEELINELYQGNYIDEMTKKWLCQTPKPPRIPILYTLTKIHKPTPIGKPIISGSRISLEAGNRRTLAATSYVRAGYFDHFTSRFLHINLKIYHIILT